MSFAGSNIDVHGGPRGSTSSPRAPMIDRLDRYPGGKNGAGTYQWIIAKMPTHAVYVEACVGSGAIFRRKVPAPASYVIDSDGRIADYWRRRNPPGTLAIEGDAVRWLDVNRLRMCDDWLVYLDPPYRLDTRTKRQLYNEEWPAAKHNELLEVISSLPARVMISGYSTPEYSLRLIDWPRYERWVMTRGGTRRKEILWCNFEPGRIDAGDWDAKVEGKNFRERERIKKRLGRWERLYFDMPAHERRVFLRKLIDLEAAALAGGIDVADGAVPRRVT